MFKRIKSKLKSRAGLSLTEMLVTVVVLMFFSTACLLGITTALKARQAAIKAADADILSSTVMQYISNEMRLSLDPRTEAIAGKTEDNKLVYDGGSTYANLTSGMSEIWRDDNGHIMRKIGSWEGEVLNDSAYSGLTLDKLHFEKSGNQLSCSFDIIDAEGNIIKSTDFSVTPINS